MGLFKKITGFILGGGDKLTLPTADGSASQVLKTDGAGNLDWVAQSGGSPAIFGTEYTYAESLGSTTNGTTTYAEKLKLTTASVPAGRYFFGWSYQWRYSNTRGPFDARVRRDGSNYDMFHIQEPASAGSDQGLQAFGFKDDTLTAGVHTVDLEFRASGGSDVATIWNARIILYRIS